jgi:hypothetical protein
MMWNIGTISSTKWAMVEGAALFRNMSDTEGGG